MTDFRELNLDRLPKKELKTPEQISRHLIEGVPNGGVVERAVHLLIFGDELQRISVMDNLTSLITEDLTTSIQRLIPLMHQTLPQGSIEYNMAACNAIKTVASKNIMPPDDFTRAFLQQILKSMCSKDPFEAETWFNTLLDIIPVVPISVLQKEVLPIATNNAKISKPVPLRIDSSKTLGRLALQFSPFFVKEKIMPVVISLCQDVSRDVRAAMVEELPNISATLGLETTKLIPHIMELSLDEHITVRIAILKAIAQMLHNLPEGVLKTTIIPYTKTVFPEIVKSEIQLLSVLSKFYGQYACGLKNVMLGSEKNEFLYRYVQLSQMNTNNRKKMHFYKPFEMEEEELGMRLIECRHNCAYNYPAMVLFASDLKKDVADNLIDVLRSLASDSYFYVGRKIAAGFYEVMNLMPRWHSQLKPQFIKLLYNDMDVVLEGMVPNISNILLKFSESGLLNPERPETGEEIGNALIACEKVLADSPQWRLLKNMLEALRVVPKVFHPDFVSDNFVPLLMLQAINGRIVLCRVAAVHTLLVILADPAQRKNKLKLRNKILELCNSASFQNRMLFLRGMNILLTLSPDTLRDLFFMNIVTMADDKVPIIRIALCQMLVQLKEIAMDPLKLSLVAAIERAVSTLRSDKDCDVNDQFRVTLPQLLQLDKLKGSCRSSDPASSPVMVPIKRATKYQLLHTTKAEKQQNVSSHMTANQLKNDVANRSSQQLDARPAPRMNTNVPTVRAPRTQQDAQYLRASQRTSQTRPAVPRGKITLGR